jgi:hypothetical protein
MVRRHNRFLSPDLVALLVYVQEDADTLDFALDLGRFDGPATDDARPAGSSGRGGDAVNGGQSIRGQPRAYSSPECLCGESHKEPPR